MKSKIKFLLFALLSLSILSCKTYNDIMVKSVRESLGKDFKSYSSFSYPTNNFGALTSFDTDLKPENQICAMNSCLDLTLTEDEWLDFKGLLDVGTGGTIELTETDQKTASIDAVLPKLWSIINVSGGFEKSSTQKVELNIGPATVRFIDKLKLKEYIDNLDDTNAYKQKYISGDLVVIVSDVVVKNMSVTVELDTNSSLKLEAAMQGGNVDSSELDFTFTKVTDGKYVFRVDKPVIIMRLPKKQPSAGGLGIDDSFNSWIPVKDFIDD